MVLYNIGFYVRQFKIFNFKSIKNNAKSCNTINMIYKTKSKNQFKQVVFIINILKLEDDLN